MDAKELRDKLTNDLQLSPALASEVELSCSQSLVSKIVPIGRDTITQEEYDEAARKCRNRALELLTQYKENGVSPEGISGALRLEGLTF